MSAQANQKELFDSSSVLVFLLKWRKQISIITISAAIISAIASFFVESKYKSTTIVYPTTTVSISKTLLKDWDDVLKFGEEKEAEQMMQILESDKIREYVNKKYNLFAHYKIKESDKLKNYYLQLEFNDRVSFTRTPYNSVEVEVLDRSPDTAAYMANDIINFVDSIKSGLYHERAKQALAIVQKEYNEKEILVNALEDSLKIYTSLGIFDYEAQSGIVYKQYVKSIAKNNTNAVQQLDAKIKLIGAKGWSYVALRDRAYYERNQLFALKTKLDQANVDVNTFLPTKYVITPAIPAEKRTYPVRWLIVLISTAAALVFSFVTMLAIEKINAMRMKLS